MKRIFILLTALSIIVLATACINSDTKNVSLSSTDSVSQIKENTPEHKPEIKIITKKDENTADLKEDVIQLNSDLITTTDYSISIVGATFDKSTGDIIEDSMAVGTGLVVESGDGSMARGFDIGFKGSDAEIAKKDAYLSLYLKYTFETEVSQRNSIIPSVDITIADNIGDDLSHVHNSLEDSYINVDYPYELVLFKGYYDSDSLFITIEEVMYELDLALIK